MSPPLKIYLQSCDLTSHIHGVKNKFSVKELGNKMEKELRNEIEKKRLAWFNQDKMLSMKDMRTMLHCQRQSGDVWNAWCIYIYMYKYMYIYYIYVYTIYIYICIVYIYRWIDK